MRSITLLTSFLFLVACSKLQGGGGAPTASAQASAAAAPPAAPHASATAAPTASAAAAALPKADPSKLELQGNAIQGGIVRAKLIGKLRKMDFPGHRAVLSEDNEFLIAFAHNAKPQHNLTITLDDGSVVEHVFEVEQRTYETDKIDGLPDKMVHVEGPAKVKLAQVEDRLEKIRKGYSKKPCHRDGFIWPANGKVTSRYGQPRILNGTDGGIHWGVDIAAPVGAQVRAPACGKVVFAELDLPLSGNTVVLDHGHGLTSTFLHLNRISVKVKDEVKQGAVIGTVGMTGRATGAHLDWRMNLFETRVDPELLAPPR